MSTLHIPAHKRYRHAAPGAVPTPPAPAQSTQALPGPAEPAGTKALQIPEHWVKGQLLDVRQCGTPAFRVTLFGERFDAQRPERALEFDNAFDCQQFVSAWYAPEALRFG